MTIKTVGELRELLDDYEDDDEVRLAFQPSWPLQFMIEDVVAPEQDAGCTVCGADLRDGSDGHDPDCDDPQQHVDDDGPSIVYITQGGHPSDSPYAPKGIWE